MTHEISINGWKLGFKDMIQIAIWFLAITGIYFTLNNRVVVNGDTIQRHQNEMTAISNRLNKMDEQGTRRSHETDHLQEQLIKQNIEAIAELNRVMRDLKPQVDKIDTNVLWLMGKALEKKL